MAQASYILQNRAAHDLSKPPGEMPGAALRKLCKNGKVNILAVMLVDICNRAIDIGGGLRFAGGTGRFIQILPD